jgi:two-component system, cell cycle response regulator DivK
MAKILYIDDEEENIKLLSRRLTKRGYEVIGATNPLDGLEKAKNEKPDLILMDITMPIMDGYEATRRLKGEDTTKSIPVIALTARAMETDRLKAIEAGVDDYAPKPVDFPLLLEKIQSKIGS